MQKKSKNATDGKSAKKSHNEENAKNAMIAKTGKKCEEGKK